ncbi:MAG TPA: amidohydrolase family protein [Solirubrobacteraceae bacterium]|nr:amidohydrolase family protein [Solirubrobacteraceae bacterium]
MGERFDLRLSGGRILLPGEDDLTEADVLVRGGTIAGLCAPGAGADVAQDVSVRGLAVLPGIIDAHVHLGQDITVPRTPDDARKETEAAAAGGVCTLIAYLMRADPYHDVLGDAVAVMERHGVIDFGFHFCIVTREQLAAVPAYASDLGVSSFKFFMNFRGDEGQYLGLPGNDDAFLLDLMRAAADAGGMVDPHGENIEIVWNLRAQPIPDGLSPLAVWNHTRPDYVESEAQQRAAFLASVAGASMYAVHVTNAQTLDVLTRQRDRYPNIFLETCPHYLTHDIDSELGPVAKVNPPLRTAADREALWQAIADGEINVIGSDHVPRHRSAKEADIWKASAGFPGLETLLPVLLSEGYHRRGVPLGRLVDTVTRAPARTFGLWPRKGAIALGADADFAIVDLDARHTVRAAEQHSGAEYSIYEGWELTGEVQHTVLRGEFVVRDREVVAHGGRGRFHPRHRSGAAALRDARAEVAV